MKLVIPSDGPRNCEALTQR